jgi:hypothetical protein
MTFKALPNKKAESTVGSSFGSSAMLRLPQHPPLSVPFSRRDWLYRVSPIRNLLSRIVGCVKQII